MGASCRSFAALSAHIPAKAGIQAQTFRDTTFEPAALICRREDASLLTKPRLLNSVGVEKLCTDPTAATHVEKGRKTKRRQPRRIPTLQHLLEGVEPEGRALGGGEGGDQPAEQDHARIVGGEAGAELAVGLDVGLAFSAGRPEPAWR